MAGRSPCPNAAAHTPCPRGFIAWHEWAEAMSRTHRQVQCRGCGRWAIWVPKVEEGAPMSPSAEQIVAVLPPDVIEAAERRIARQREGCCCFWAGLVIHRRRQECPIHGWEVPDAER